VRIAIVTESFLPQVNGVTNSVVRIVDHLERNGHDAIVLAPGPGDAHHSRTPVARLAAVALPVYRSFPVGLPSPRLALTLRSFRPDLVHLASPAALGAAGALAARRLGLPTVAVFQSDLPGFAQRYRAGVIAPALWRWLRWIHSQTDLTLAPSTATAWALERHGIAPVARWERGVDTDRFHPRHRCEDLRRHLAPRGESVVGYVGRLAAEKQVRRLALLADVPGTRLVIVGDGPARRDLERRLPRASFLGFRTGDDLSRLVASFDVFVHPGSHETFCQAIQEALAAAVPVVAPATGGPLDLVRHGENGYLFPAHDPASMRSAVCALARDPVRRAAMGLAARQGVADRSWAAVGDELVAHYRAVLGASTRQARAA
jgi:phosphatidylinositol alpha 1,6-mannosyltransferase